ncbi:porimin isoform X2 [Lepisosteus oculatus]|uniref:porimin isoform X2 n=1 Tax=Lepisosteus oculatus TaxID=7918 RepID=UPI003712A75A
MKITVFCVFVAGQLAICFFVSCASDQCSSLTDCQSCLNQTSCTWLIYLNESSPSCKNYTTPDGKNQKCTAEDKGAALSLLAPNSTVTQTTTSVQTALTNISSAVGNTSTSTTTTTMTTSSPLNTSAALPKTTAVTYEGSRFDAGSFVGGMTLALGMTLILFLGYKFSCYRGEVQYRTIEEHDAII